MTIIGFDIGKNEIIGARISKTGIQKEVYCVVNGKKEIVSFLRSLKTKYGKLGISVEATGQYHRNLCLACLRLDIPCWVLNPVITKQFTRATVRKKKTDITDALATARLALQKQGTLATKEMFSCLKKINRVNYRLGKMYQVLHLMNDVFSSALPEEKEVIKRLDNISCLIEESVKQINVRIDKEIDKDLASLLSSIVGIGPAIARTLIVEIGNVERFPSGKELVAYAGLDPKVKQSSMTNKRNVRLTKRGSPYLRRALFIAASIAQRHDLDIKRYYEKKRNEGKTYREATCAVARKIVYRVYAVWKRKTPYIRSEEEKTEEKKEKTRIKQCFPQEKVLT